MPKFIGWVPTSPEFINAFFELAPVTSTDVVYDLGSGDGRLLFGAIEKGAGKCIGVDIDPDRVKVASEAAVSRGLNGEVTFIESDVMDVDLSPATLVLCYLYPTASAALRPKFEKELKSGTRVVMESFPVPGWKPLKTNENTGRTFYLYNIPAEHTPDYDTAINHSVYEPYDSYYDSSSND